MVNVAVLMSTYNGEKYLLEQVDSILNQQGVNVFLYVRDDGSTDTTCELLRKIEKKNKNVFVKYGLNQGAPLSFMQLIKDINIVADYYALSDQDDIWMPEKLVRAVQLLSQNGQYDLYASNQTVVDSNNNVIGMRFVDNPPTDLLNIIDKNYLSGCTMVMKERLLLRIKESIPNSALVNSRMHDTWLIAVAACLGRVIYDSSSYINYRQHENNVVGIRKIGLRKKLCSKLKSQNINYHKCFADELLKLFGQEINQDSKNIIMLYHNSDSINGKIRLIMSPLFESLYFRNKILFALKMLLFE